MAQIAKTKIIMTRKEEILHRAIEFVDKSYLNVGIKTTHEASVSACQEIAEWADRTMLDKACKWIAKNYINYAHTRLGAECLTNDFKRAMEK